MNLLDPPGDLLKRPELMQAVMEAYQERETREVPVLGPKRREMVLSELEEEMNEVNLRCEPAL